MASKSGIESGIEISGFQKSPPTLTEMYPKFSFVD